jgi:ferredoxin
MMGCDDCLYDSQDYIDNLKNMMDGVFDGSILEGRLAIIRSDGRDSGKIQETVKEFYDKIGQKKRINIQFVENAYEGKRDGFLGLLSILCRQTDLKSTIKAHKMFPFGFIDSETDSCDLCLQCTKICPFNALEVREKTLAFNHAKCTGCGLCVDACEKGLLNLNHEIRVDALANSATLIKNESESTANRES